MDGKLNFTWTRTYRSMKTNFLGYCSNLHVGENLEDIYKNISVYIQKVREKWGKTNISSGLWISYKATCELEESNIRQEFIKRLKEAGIILRTLNGFPFGDFHQERVKESVYLPDWSEKKRVEYTMKLAQILVNALPKNEYIGTISTLPLGYDSTWNKSKMKLALIHLNELSLFLNELEKESSKRILICLEPEPNCVIESSQELISFFKIVKEKVKFPEYFAVCFDVCHQAVMGEDIVKSLEQIIQEDIPLGKIQLSNALHLDPTKANSKDLAQTLNNFSDKRYLHQVKSRDDKGNIYSWSDLESAHNDLISHNYPFRIHFHIPLHLETLPQEWLFTTSLELRSAIEFLNNHSELNPHLEVETYSWQVLPENLRPSNDSELIDGIYKELLWVEERLENKIE